MRCKLTVIQITVELSEDGDGLTPPADMPVERLLARAANGVRDVTTLVATVVLVATFVIPPMTPSSTPTRPGATRYKIARTTQWPNEPAQDGIFAGRILSR